MVSWFSRLFTTAWIWLSVGPDDAGSLAALAWLELYFATGRSPAATRGAAPGASPIGAGSRPPGGGGFTDDGRCPRTGLPFEPRAGPMEGPCDMGGTDLVEGFSSGGRPGRMSRVAGGSGFSTVATGAVGGR